jgi:hypothetical protein
MLNPTCDAHETPHDPGLPDEPLRAHVLAQAVRAAEETLRSHGYADVDRSAEILHVALADAFEAADQHDDELN